MKLLVTGSDGFFASWLIPALGAAGHEVVGCDVKSGGDLFNHDDLVARLAGCDAVVHLAAWPHYKTTIPAQEFTRLNIIGTAKLVEAMADAKVRRLVYTSSGAMYGFGPNRSLDGWVKPPITENTDGMDWTMVDAYGASKVACETWLALLPSRSWTITTLRINCIEPHHEGAITQGHHWGWWCSQALTSQAFEAAAQRESGGFQAVNVAEPSANVDRTQLDKLLAGKL